MSIEVEAKYLLPDAATLQAILKVRQLGEYAVRPQHTVRVMDQYLDTHGRSLLRQGWACRLRHRGEAWIVGLKNAQEIRGAIVSRGELEMPLPVGDADPRLWPEGEIRTLVLRLVGGEALVPLIEFEQERHEAALLKGESPIAQLSLDIVDIVAGGKQHRRYLLECELNPDGDPADLERIEALLMRVYPLIPEPRSKLQLALELLEKPL